jgi:hypothetical protein
VTKTHEKLMKKYFPGNTVFVDSFDEIDQKESDIVVISTSQITNMVIAEKIKKFKNPFFLEKKGIHTYNMMVAMENSKYGFMIANCDIRSNLFDNRQV